MLRKSIPLSAFSIANTRDRSLVLFMKGVSPNEKFITRKLVTGNSAQNQLFAQILIGLEPHPIMQFDCCQNSQLGKTGLFVTATLIPGQFGRLEPLYMYC
jgi:hypothetical protein